MKVIQFDFTDSGTTHVDGHDVTWGYHQRVPIHLHESTETYSCRLIGGERMSLHDLKRKLRFKFRAAAAAEARRKYVAMLDAEERGEKIFSPTRPAGPQ
jgi:hypothetical protein